jgi:hypothetical protein
MTLLEILKDKLNERYINLINWNNFELERSRIIRKFDAEYEKILKAEKLKPYYTKYSIIVSIRNSTKMQKYKKEMAVNNWNRKAVIKNLTQLKREIKTLNVANSKLTK